MQPELCFGDDGSAQFTTLSGMGAFFDATTERIFEESGKGILAMSRHSPASGTRV